MIIKNQKNKGKPNHGQLLNVYAIYWVGEKRYFLTSPPKYRGVLTFSEDDAEIVDNHLSQDMVLTKSSGGTEMILHSALEKDGFIDRLIDDGQGNYDEFVSRLGCEP